MADIPVPADREIDGIDQSAFLAGEQDHSNRDGFIYWTGLRMDGVKWQHFKFPMIEQKYMFDPALDLPTSRIINLLTDPEEREPYNAVYGHTWTLAHFSRIPRDFHDSVVREPLIPGGRTTGAHPRGMKHHLPLA